MRAEPGGFINADRLDFRKYAARPAIAKVLVDFLLYHDHNPRKALELAAEATVAVRTTHTTNHHAPPPDTTLNDTKTPSPTTKTGGGKPDWENAIINLGSIEMLKSSSNPH